MCTAQCSIGLSMGCCISLSVGHVGLQFASIYKGQSNRWAKSVFKTDWEEKGPGGGGGGGEEEEGGNLGFQESSADWLHDQVFSGGLHLHGLAIICIPPQGPRLAHPNKSHPDIAG